MFDIVVTVIIIHVVKIIVSVTKIKKSVQLRHLITEFLINRLK